ncbi:MULTISPECIES: 4-aminobutyrate--2-oxoglutarate transaminase [unclassified Pseudodesulfovibrio]|uniref:4-aminobutyrate--2-oxoglutarate transaminase n=1 Tax=unclassified Pseudodesulfovibrio TaxID=2661612 RepID=UPI000FEC211A|nr:MULTISPECIES: 4-aminobutyrate--2-oxoglutarate transaminase [unclassified Pseudodesulfovibrio]MCJ2165055.1 4-aminobutyrate--2-oxoglutarate transaminase [Pseudodesulfovibrio sp. S3-i]RWU03504.1 4-aminobutyrate--2-oxoglutarate transaminase [Pseudodesulfovibrio sp. S3]
MKTKALLERREKAVPRGVTNITSIFADSAKGATITDVEGREYIDFASGIGVNNIGHCHPKVVAAIREQAGKLLHSCYHVVQYEGYVALAERLNKLTPGDFEKKTVLLNSGAEAVENAVKIARHATGRPAVIASGSGFHGRTLLAASLTAKVMPYKAGFGPYAPEIYRIPFAYCYRCPVGCSYPNCNIACADLLKKRFVDLVDPASVAAVILEPVAGEGGFLVPPKEYFPRIKEICEEFGILLIIDEVQTGICRTGTMFAIEQWDVVPDLLTSAKSLGGGMPISAVTGRAELMDAPQVGGLGGTYGGNPVSCAAALAAVDVAENENLAQRSRELGAKVRTAFEDWARKFDCIGDIRGLGSMLALELVHDRKEKTVAPDLAKAMVAECQKNGLIILSCGNGGNVIRTLMPLVSTDQELERGLNIMEAAFASVTQG